jgi:signal transduction histidine kinase
MGPAGESLETGWSGEPTLRDGAAIALTTSRALADGRRAYDLSFPIVRGGREIATYHTGLDADWLDAQTEEPVRQTLLLWAGVIIGMAAIVIVTSVCLYYLVKNAALTHELEMAHLQRAMEQNELARGLAHEIRNPLNAVRLNLHIFERFLEHPDVLSREEIRRVLSDSLRETMQIETLVSELLGFVRSGPPQMEDLELGEVATAALEFFRPSCAEAELIGPICPKGASFPVCGDRTHIRQVVLNLLRNAHEAAGAEGRIELSLSKEHGRATLAVADNGPPVPPSDIESVFEPFYSGRARNLGLSLALVRKHIQEAGGHVWCESPNGAGAKFCVQLPLREK